MVNGISRLNDFPVLMLLCTNRLRLGSKLPVVYHCRGGNAANWALRLRKMFPGDKVVLDVRGYWPAELLYNRGIDDPALAKGKDLEDHDRAYKELKAVIGKADAVTTVSNALKELLISEMGAPEQTAVVPCCINKIATDEKRSEIRKSWGLADDEIAIVYSGTTAAYQHLEDLTIPFLKKLMEQSVKNRLVFLSSEDEKIKKMLIAAGLPVEKIIIKSFPQQEVANALTACDAGILIRKPTLVNKVANPVKIAEYLASGLPIIIEKGVGGVAENMFEQLLLKGIEITKKGEGMDKAAAEVSLWLKGDIGNKRKQVRDYAKEFYFWNSAIQVSRKMYSDILTKK